MRNNRKSRLTTIVVAFIGAAAIGGVAWVNRDEIAVRLAPRKKAVSERSQAALKADELFWRTFHNGAYSEIPHALDALTAAYLAAPDDSVTAGHIAWLHNWRMAERERLPQTPPTITDEVMMARRYFEEANRLNPSDARILAFLAGHTVAEGSIHKDERLVRRGYFMLLDAIDAWPEFSLFTAGYVMSRLPADSPRFEEGLEWQWRNLDVCVGEDFDRVNPDYAKYLKLETREGPKRACWNSRIAPHNLEGFFLNLGDMLVKSGDWQTGEKIYANAKRLPDYATWKYAGVLEARIAQAQDNVTAFNAEPGEGGRPIMINSSFACMACHQY